MTKLSKQQGFTITELMVAMTAGLVAISALYTLGSNSTKSFHRAQDLSDTQERTREAFRQLTAGIARAGYLGTPNANLEQSCEVAPTLPSMTEGVGLPFAAVHYYTAVDDAIVDPLGTNGVVSDRIRVMANYEGTERLPVTGLDDADKIQLNIDATEWQRAFEGTDLKDTAYTLAAQSFHASSWLHFEAANGRHFFRRFLGVDAVGDSALGYTSFGLIGLTLPFETICLPGNGEGMTVTPLSWYEYAVIDPLGSTDGNLNAGETAGYKFLYHDLAEGAVVDVDAADIFESPNAILVRRRLNVSAVDASVTWEYTEFLVEFVANFALSFVVDANSGTSTAPSFSVVAGSDAETLLAATPQQVRAVIVDIAVRTPTEDPSFIYVERGDDDPLTHFELHADQTGSARVRNLHFEIPVPNVASRNL